MKLKPVPEKIYMGLNAKGQFVVDEDTKKEKYTVEDRFSQFQYKINEIIDYLDYQNKRIQDLEDRRRC